MLARFSLGILFAVLVAASRPVPTGGEHDLFAVGVGVQRIVHGKPEVDEKGNPVERFILAAPDREAVRAYDALMRSPARGALLQGTTVRAAAGKVEADASRPEAEGGARILELVYYGHRSRAGRAPIVFTASPAEAPAGSAEAWEVARSIAALPDMVTAATARVLLRSPDDASFRDALEALAEVRADVASSEALAVALAPAGDESADSYRRLVAEKVLRRLGGPAVYPEAFRKLAEEARVRQAAR